MTINQFLEWMLNALLVVMIGSVFISFMAPWLKDAVESIREIFKS